MSRWSRTIGALVSGLLIGAALVFAAVLSLSGSVQAACLFSIVAVGFLVPFVLVVAFASAPTQHEERSLPNRLPKKGDVAIAVAYVAAVVPYWFAAMSAINGRFGLMACLLLVYAAMAILPLRSLLRVRRAIQAGLTEEQG